MRRMVLGAAISLPLHTTAMAVPDDGAPQHLKLLQDIVDVNTDTRNVAGLTRALGVGYGRDGNNLADVGIQLLVGAGSSGGGMHSHKKFLLLSSNRDRLSLMNNRIDKFINPEGDSL